MSNIQSILFDKKKWDISSAYHWIISHDQRPMKKAHITKNNIRFRIKPPSHFRRFRTFKLHNGIDLVIGFR